MPFSKTLPWVLDNVGNTPLNWFPRFVTADNVSTFGHGKSGSELGRLVRFFPHPKRPSLKRQLEGSHTVLKGQTGQTSILQAC